MIANLGWTPALSRRWDQGIVRYPGPAVEVLDPRFGAYWIGKSAVKRLYTGARWAEGLYGLATPGPLSQLRLLLQRGRRYGHS